jgi:hypothetical protein
MSAFILDGQQQYDVTVLMSFDLFVNIDLFQHLIHQLKQYSKFMQLNPTKYHQYGISSAADALTHVISTHSLKQTTRLCTSNHKHIQATYQLSENL